MAVLFRQKTIHFVGIGGIGMSGIAEVLAQMGFQVQGSDLRPSVQTRRLEKLGVCIHLTHQPVHVHGADVVVMSSACDPTNPEIMEARRIHIPVIRRAEMLAELMRLKFGIAIAGAHGKTTTTSMIGLLTHEAGLDPTVLIGGRLSHFDSNARHGQGTVLVAEADESDGSFLHLNPALAVITNMDREHMDHYGSLDRLESAFVEFANKTPFYGATIVCTECPTLKRILPKFRSRTLTYGFSDSASVYAKDIRPMDIGNQFEVLVRPDPDVTPQFFGTFEIQMAGRHNVLNALATITVGRELGLSLEIIQHSLRHFRGVDRRLQIRLQSKLFWLIDDYGHHPTEIHATLSAVREFRKGRLITVFQPHRYSRTKDLWSDFINCFSQTDVLYLMDIYPALELPLEGITSQKLVEAMGSTKPSAHYAGSWSRSQLVQSLLNQLEPGDTLLTLGAGTTSDLATELEREARNRTAMES